MSTILTPADFADAEKYYYIPIRMDIVSDKAAEKDIKRLLGVIEFSQEKFCSFFGITETQIETLQKQEALKYFTFAEWLKSEYVSKTPQGTGSKPQLVKGTPTYDIQKYVNSMNFAIRTMNKDLSKETQKKELKSFLNY